MTVKKMRKVEVKLSRLSTIGPEVIFRWATNYLATHPKLRQLERRLSTHSNPRFSVTLMIAVRLRILFECAFRYVLFFGHTRGALRPTRKLKLTGSGRQALVLGNGPSLQRLNLSYLNELPGSVRPEIFAVNFFPLTQIGSQVEFEYSLVLSDPGNRPTVDDYRNQELWNAITSSDKITLVVPATWQPDLRTRQLTNQIFYFNDLSLETWIKGTSPIWPRGYQSLTVYKALAFCSYKNFDLTAILGIDNSMFKNIRVNVENEFVQETNHAPGPGYDIPRALLTSEYPRGVGDYFFDTSQSFLDLAAFFGDFPIVNLDPDSFVDAFPKHVNSNQDFLRWRL